MTKHIKGFLLPVLIAFSPIIFLYSHNAKVLSIGNLVVPLLGSALFAAILYGLFYIFQREPVSASLSAVIFLLANFFYGSIYAYLLKKNRFPVEHFTLLPVVVYLACYAAYFFKKTIRPAIGEVIQTILLVGAVVMVGYNTAKVVPIEIRKANLSNTGPAPAASAALESPSKKYPDVYYVILDEYAGFDTIRQYWHENYVDSFEAFLKDNHFFYADQSRSHTSATILEVASRLNFQSYPDTTDQLSLVKAITDSKVMRLFKSYGYTTVAFSGPFPPYNADYNFGDASQVVPDNAVGTSEFQQMLIENSMLDAFSSALQNNTTSAKELDYIKYEFTKISSLSEVKSPKFVVAHLLFPHVPFVADKEGNVLDPMYQYNWNYYLGQHMYATRLAQELITRLLKNADPDNPPVIIIQSDHGARNEKRPTRDSIILDNFAQHYQNNILFALYLPGYDTAQLPRKIDPIDTFVIVMNHYLDAGIHADK